MKSELETTMGFQNAYLEPGGAFGKRLLVASIGMICWIFLLDYSFTYLDLKKSYVETWLILAPAFQVMEAFVFSSFLPSSLSVAALEILPMEFLAVRLLAISNLVGAIRLTLKCLEYQSRIVKKDISRINLIGTIYLSIQLVFAAFSVIAILVLTFAYLILFTPLNWLWMFVVGAIPRAMQSVANEIEDKSSSEVLPGRNDDAESKKLYTNSIIPFTFMFSAVAIYFATEVGLAELLLQFLPFHVTDSR